MEQNDLKAQNEIWMPEATDSSFMANGTKYTVSRRLSIERLALHQKYEVEFGYGASFLEIMNVLKEAYLLLNDKKFADAAVHIANTMNGIVKVDEREISAVRLCSLFINYEGEDTATYNEDVYTKKLEDWSKANIDAMYFFQQAAISTHGYINAFKELTKNTLIQE